MQIFRRVKYLYCLIAGFIFLLCCTFPSQNKNVEQFNVLYQEFQKKSYADYDTLVNFYYKVDSVNSVQPAYLLEYLKKTIEARLNYREAAYQKSNKNYEDGISILTQCENVDSLIAANYVGKGMNFMNMGVFDSACYYYTKAETLYDSLKNTRRLQVVYTNMAMMYYNKREVDKAMQLINKAVADTTNLTVILAALHLKANIYGSGGIIDSAMNLDRHIIAKYGADQGNNYLMSSFYNNLGMCFLEKRMIDSALYYCKKSYIVDSLSGIRMNMGLNLILLGDICLENENQKQTTEYYTRALQIFSDDNNTDKEYIAYESLVQLALQNDDYKQAVVYQDSMLHIYKKINNEVVNRTIERLNIEFESVKKNQKIIEQKNQLKNQRAILMFILLIAILVIAILYYYFKYRSKVLKLKMAEQDTKVLSMLVEAEQNERSRIAADLHDSVSQKLAVIQMHLSLVEPANDKTEKISELLNDTVTDVRDISHNLFPKDLINGIVPAIESLCEHNNMTGKNMLFQFFPDGAIRDKLSVGKSLDFVLYRIVQELINNAVKYSKAEQVEIRLSITGQHIKLEVLDNGIGFDVNILKNTRGIGLNNLVDRIKHINGTIDIFSDNTGARFIIIIPL